ncbi:MAG: folate-binding protein YgfZ [Rubrivivax sp.]|nr:folate-binding protein YgfZ [Rubrivivax sp.]
MISAWSEYLQTQGAVLIDGVAGHFGDPAAELAAARDGLVLADLSHYGLIAFAGEDAQTFLHGQITNDLRALRETNALFAGYCSPKGRLLANFLVFRRGGDILLMLPRALREATQKRLTLFVLRAKVRVRDASDEWVTLGLAGPGAADLIASRFGSVPADTMGVVQADTGWAVRLGSERFDLFVSPEAAPALWQDWSAKAKPIGTAAWDWLTVNAGVPTILPQTQDHFVPQMANMEVLHGVSFQKGCYPGQEIVARSQYLGKLKRRMYLAHVDGTAAPGDELYSPDLAGQACGLVANAAPAPEGGTDLLAVMQTSSFEGGEVHLGSADGARLAFKTLPYAW